MKHTVFLIATGLVAVGALVVRSCEQCNDPNEEYLECGTACPKTCQNLEAELQCIEKCVPGCFCKEGFVRSNSTGTCIPPCECPSCPKVRVRRAPKPIIPCPIILMKCMMLKHMLLNPPPMLNSPSSPMRLPLPAPMLIPQPAPMFIPQLPHIPMG